MGDDSDKYPPRYDHKDTAGRAVFLCERCQTFLDEISRRLPSSQFSFDPYVFLNVAQSALDDIWRYKAYHLQEPEKLSDAVKRAAYFTKWTVRLRPIYYARVLSGGIPEGPIDRSDPTFLMNEGFAIQRGLDTIATEIGAAEIHIDPEFRANFIYDLHYRNISEDALLAVYEIIRNAAIDKPIILKVIKIAPTEP